MQTPMCPRWSTPRCLTWRWSTLRWSPACSAVVLFTAWVLGIATVPQPAAAEDPASVAFFENRIRPVLVEHCYECHSQRAEDEVGGGLWLDSAAGMNAGGDSGPALVAGDAQASILVSALRYQSSEMPPEGKLPESTIEDFERWIAAGAPDPRNSNAPVPRRDEIDIEAGREFWCFRPIDDPPVPPPVATTMRGQRDDVDVQESDGGDVQESGTIDRFVRRRLADEGLTPVPATDDRNLLRRLAFDLTGLPPSVELQQRFADDDRTDRYTRVVDQLLASPEFARHWARHWMDVVRYADSNGSDFNATFHDAWRYRDFLVRSFAEDRPFDDLIRLQIAGDLVQTDSFQNDQRSSTNAAAMDDAATNAAATNAAAIRDGLVATTYLTLGTKMLSERDKSKLRMDVVDEQIDTIGRSLMGMTLGCARCHDHKFDPVPTRDYYAVAGFFRSTQSLDGEIQRYVSNWVRRELPVDAAVRKAITDHADQVKQTERIIKSLAKRVEHLRSQNAIADGGVLVDDVNAVRTGQWTASTYSKTFIGAGYLHDGNTDRGHKSITFELKPPRAGAYRVRLAAPHGGNRASKVRVTVSIGDRKTKHVISQRKRPPDGLWHDIAQVEITQVDVPQVDVGRIDAVRLTVDNRDADGYVVVDAASLVPVDAPEHRGVDASGDSSGELVATSKRLDDARAKLKRLKANPPPPIPVAMSVRERPDDQIGDSPVFIRGESDRPGSIVPRGYLRVCGGTPTADIPAGQSGRAQLAAWLTDPDHPLTARVYVNRVWMHLIGEGIVRTVDNFGVRGERPDHPELLDHLASAFVRDAWSTKRLVRRIVLSQTYRRGDAEHPAAESFDPENRLLWRSHRRRLPAEAIRETMLVAAGELDRGFASEPVANLGTLVTKNNGGESIEAENAGRPLRSLYLATIRNYVSPLLSELNVADPDLIVGRRVTTDVPSQALALLNSPLVHRWSAAAARRTIQRHASFDQRLSHSIATTLHRSVRDDDRRLAESFFQIDHESSPIDSVDRRASSVDRWASSVDRWTSWYAALFASTEFRHLD